VLVPGAGLGRLAFDIARRGYSCQGNEFSFYMLLASNFILNRYDLARVAYFRVEVEHQFTIYPWLHTFSNQLSAEQQIKPVTLPDIRPTELGEGVEFSMVAGEFLEVYDGQTGNDGIGA
jgi:carnosine N-methyltransferase